MEDNCIFCKIANGEIPSATVYEDETFRAILDLSPAAKGHTLFELPDETAAKALMLAKKLGAVLKEGLHADGLNVVQNNGEAAGQTVLHFHMHLIPRYSGDTVNVGWKPGHLTDEDRDEVLKLFQK